jgi:transcriptional regulator with XRE-family HTH domain
MALGEELAAQRIAKNLSLREVGERAKLDHSMILRLEQNKRLPSLQTLQALSLALDCVFTIANGEIMVI